MPKRRQQSGLFSFTIQWLVMLLLLVVALAPVGVLTYYAMTIAADSMARQIDAENFAAVSNFRGQVGAEFRERFALVQAASEIPRMVRAVATQDRLPATEDMKNLTTVDAGIERAFILTPEGAPWAAYPTIANEDYLDSYADESWFQDALGGPVISSVSERVPRGADRPRPFMIFASPVTVSGTILGIVALEYSAKELSDWIKSASDSYLFLLDHEGKTIIHPHLPAGQAVTDAYASIGLVQRVYNSDNLAVSGQYDDPVTGQAMLATFVPFTDLGRTWVVVAQRPYAVVSEDLRAVRSTIGFMGLLLTAITLVIVVMLGREVRGNLRLTRELADKNLKLRETDAIVRSSNDAIIGLAPDWTIRTWNTGAQVLYGWPAHHLLGHPFDTVIGPENTAELASLRQQLDQGKDLRNHEMTHKRASGESVPVALTLSRIPDEDGSVAGYSAIVRDITAQKELETVRQDFMSFVVHQLKGPVAAVKSTIELVMDGDYGPVSDELKTQLALTQDRVDGQVRLMNDMLNVSRVERGVIELNRTVTPVMAAVNRAIRDYIQPYKNQNLSLDVVEKDKDLKADMDMEKVAEAISNSVSNALKHTKEGGVTITVFAQSGRAVIEVTDTGEGMDQEMIGKLFTRDKVIGKNTAAAGSAGLGLYIAKQFLELHSGTITVRSEPGKGTTFRYELPLHQG
jgi:PAS domain S-box-containing protein